MKTVIEANLRGIHAGQTGDADSLFLKKNCIAVDWPRLGEETTRQEKRG